MMRLRERSLIFDGVDLAEEYGLYYSKFEEELPQKKLVTVQIPYGADIDITDRLGGNGWTNGKHHLTFMLYGDTEEERLRSKDKLIASVHGRMAQYRLSWDEPYVYTGRASVTVSHRFENADVITIDIDRWPWKRATIEERVSLVDRMNPTSNLQTTVYKFDKHKRYRDVRVTALTRVAGGWEATGSNFPDSYGVDGAANELITDEVYFGSAYRFKLYSRSDWLMRASDTGELIVSNTYFKGVTSGDATIDSPYVVTDGDMLFTNEKKQYVTLKYEAWDV